MASDDEDYTPPAEVTTLLKAMRTRLKLVSVQKNAGNDYTALLDDQLKAVLADLAQLTLEPEDAVFLSNKSKEMELWSEAQLRLLHKAMADSATRPGPPGKREQQTCDHVENYVTVSMVVSAQDASKTIQAKARSWAPQIYNWGLVCGREKVWTRFAAVLTLLCPDQAAALSPKDPHGQGRPSKQSLGLRVLGPVSFYYRAPGSQENILQDPG